MAAIAVTNAWLDPSASLVADQVYIVQNRTPDIVRFFEGAAFDAVANANDGVELLPLGAHGAGPNHMRWTYISTNEVRLRMVGPTKSGVVEFALAS